MTAPLRHAPGWACAVRGGAQDSEVASSELFDPGTNTSAGPRRDGRAAQRKLCHDPARWSRAGGRWQQSTRIRWRSTRYRGAVRSGDRDVQSNGPNGRRSEAHVATLLADGRVLVIGGFGSNSDVAQIFDPGTGSWTLAGSMLHPRFSGATLLQDGRVLVSGGMDSMATTELFDPSTGQFERAHRWPTLATAIRPSALPRPRAHHRWHGWQPGHGERGGVRPGDQSDLDHRLARDGTHRRLGGSALRWSCHGGRRSLVNDAPLSAELYDPNTGTFQQAAFATRSAHGRRAPPARRSRAGHRRPA